MISNNSSLRDAVEKMNHLQWFAEGDVEAAKRFIETDEGKEWLTTAASALGFLSPDEIEAAKSGIAKKNQELIGEKRALQKKVTEMEEGASVLTNLKKLLADYEIVVDDEGEIDYDKIEQALQRQRRGGEGGDDPGDAEELKRQLRKAQRDLEEANRKVETANGTIKEKDETIATKDGAIKDLLIDGGLRSALAKAGYSEVTIPVLLPSLREKSKAEIQLDEETGTYKAVTDDGRSLEDWVDKYWKDTDEGKALRTSGNAGGGGRGSGGKGGGSTKPWAEMTGAERTQLYNDNPELYRQKRDESRKNSEA